QDSGRHHVHRRRHGRGRPLRSIPLIETRRLLLVPATERSLRAEIGGDRAALAGALGVAEPAAWPPELYDGEAMRYCLDLLLGDPGYAAWGLHYFALKTGRRPELIGAGGYKGAPRDGLDRKSTRLNSSHVKISYAVFCLKKNKNRL